MFLHLLGVVSSFVGFSTNFACTFDIADFVFFRTRVCAFWRLYVFCVYVVFFVWLSPPTLLAQHVALPSLIPCPPFSGKQKTTTLFP